MPGCSRSPPASVDHVAVAAIGCGAFVVVKVTSPGAPRLLSPHDQRLPRHCFATKWAPLLTRNARALSAVVRAAGRARMGNGEKSRSRSLATSAGDTPTNRCGLSIYLPSGGKHGKFIRRSGRASPGSLTLVAMKRKHIINAVFTTVVFLLFFLGLSRALYPPNGNTKFGLTPTQWKLSVDETLTLLNSNDVRVGTLRRFQIGPLVVERYLDDI